MSNASATTQYTMSTQTFEELGEYARRLTGRRLTTHTKFLFEERLRKRLLDLRVSSFDEYVQLVRSDSNAAHQVLISVSTIDESYFFRDESQFIHLRESVLPEILATKVHESEPSVRIWSAAAAKGEEAYSIAMVALDYFKEQKRRITLRIHASDINQRALVAAQNGLYDQFSTRNTPAYYKTKYLINEGDAYRVSDEIRRVVQFQALNLCDESQYQAVGGCDIIFCRNVLHTFDRETKQCIVNNLFGSLSSHGALYLGHTETLSEVENSLIEQHAQGIVFYRKGETPTTGSDASQHTRSDLNL